MIHATLHDSIAGYATAGASTAVLWMADAADATLPLMGNPI